VLWITAKAQNAALCLPIAVYGLGMVWGTSNRKAYYAGVGGIAAICLTGVFMYRSVLPATKVTALYNVVFYGILPASNNPESDLAALGLNPEYARYSGTLPWSPGTGVADGALVNALQLKVSPVSVMAFYLKRPARMWQHIETLFPAYLSLRPEFCGNFDRSAGRPPGARSNAIALWSTFHDRALSRVGAFVLSSLRWLLRFLAED
jgi:hypothetical protein